MKRVAWFSLGVALAWAAVAFAQSYPSQPTFLKWGLNVGPNSTTATTLYAGPTPLGTAFIQNNTDGTGGALHFVNREVGVDAQRTEWHAATLLNGASSEIALCSLSIGCGLELAYTSDTTATLALGLGTGAIPVETREQLRAIDGAIGSPAYSFTSDQNSGFYSSAADAIGVSLGGTQRGGFSTTQFLYADGAAGTPTFSFLSDTNHGVYRVGADNLGIALGGALEYDFNATVFDLNDNSIDDSADDNVNVSANMSVVGNLAVTGTISGGGIGAVYGCYVDAAAAAERCTSGLSASVAGTVFTITHNLSLVDVNDLALSCTIHDNANDDRFCQIATTGANSFTVKLTDVGAGAIADDFSFTGVRTQ